MTLYLGQKLEGLQQPDQQEAAAPELQQVLALAGLPGSSLPAAMAAAHAAVAAHAQQRHRCGQDMEAYVASSPRLCGLDVKWTSTPATVPSSHYSRLPLAPICDQAASGPA